MSYRLDYTDEVRRTLKTLPGNYRQRFKRLIESLLNTPYLATAAALRDMPGRYRIRLDRWRLIYRVNEDEQIIIILTVRRKSGPETYQNLE